MKVKLTTVLRAGGNTEDDNNRVGEEFILVVANVGRGGYLAFFDDPEKYLLTSRIEEIGILSGHVTIITRNTEYRFEIL